MFWCCTNNISLYRNLPIRGALHNRAAPIIVRGSSQLPGTYYRMKIGQFPREIWPFFLTKCGRRLSLAPLITVRF